jgi:phosphate:Na+ symporter
MVLLAISTAVWKSLAGIAIFLLGMNFMEESLRLLAGRPFKLFLKKNTTNNIKAIGGGAVVAAVLQSSSITNLMVLAFVGAGIIQMQNALAIILGANLGTTVTSWLIATVGFGFNIEDLALPVAGIAGITMMLVNKESRFHQWTKMAFGLSFLFIGLNYIKTGIEEIIQGIDISIIKDHPAIVFLLAGFIVTSLVQSSSVTVAIVLSALHANAITLLSATAAVLGAEIGTTIKLLLASIKGIAAKRRVAIGNLLFNIISTIIIFIFLVPINRLLVHFIGSDNNLITLVAFQTFVNLAGIIVFYPFLGTFGRLLQKLFVSADNETFFIRNVAVSETELALEALEKETRNFIFLALGFANSAFESHFKIPEDARHRSFEKKQLKEKYEYIKTLHGEIYKFSVGLQATSLPSAEAVRLSQLISCFRNCMYAAKNIEDALHDIAQLRNSSNDAKYNYYLENKKKISAFSEQVCSLIGRKEQGENFDAITGLYKKTQQGYIKSLEELYKEGIAKHVNQIEISTLINFNREMYTALKSMVFAFKDFLLTENEADQFDSLPGFIR